MATFSYQAFDQYGNSLRGKLQAEDEATAADKLRKMNYTVVEISPTRESSLLDAFRKGRKVKIADIAVFCRQLSAMLKAGIPLTRSLYTLSEQQKNPTLAKALNEIAGNVEAGTSFSDALSAYPAIFSEMFVDMVRAGELGGALDLMLERLAQQLERDKSLRDNVRSATFYPTVVLAFAACVVLVIIMFVVPIFTSFFPAGTELPLLTVLIMALSESLRHFWYLYGLFLVLLVVGVMAFIKSEFGRRAWDLVKFRLPLVGSLFHKVTVARFSRTLATLMAGGIPVLHCLEAAGAASGSVQVSEAVEMAEIGIQEGQTIATPLQQSGFFPPMLVNMVSVGEETGDLPSLLNQMADFYEEEVATMTKGLTSLIEPVLIIFLGFIIGGIVISIYLPIFNAVTSMGVG